MPRDVVAEVVWEAPRDRRLSPESGKTGRLGEMEARARNRIRQKQKRPALELWDLEGELYLTLSQTKSSCGINMNSIDMSLF